jgi:hypothetical protein
MLSDVLSVHIKAINSIPRVALAPIFIMIVGLGLASGACHGISVFGSVAASADILMHRALAGNPAGSAGARTHMPISRRAARESSCRAP